MASDKTPSVSRFSAMAKSAALLAACVAAAMYALNFFSSALAHLISLEIASATYSNQCLSYEGLCKKIPNKLGCRSTIYSTLNNAVSKGFFIKKFSKKDRRIRSYCLSENYSLMLTQWYLDQKQYFSN